MDGFKLLAPAGVGHDIIHRDSVILYAVGAGTDGHSQGSREEKNVQGCPLSVTPTLNGRVVRCRPLRSLMRVLSLDSHWPACRGENGSASDHLLGSPAKLRVRLLFRDRQ